MRNRPSPPDDVLVKAFLHNALSLLRDGANPDPIPLTEKFAAVESFIANGQFKLALNALAEAGHQTTPNAKFWHSLSNAARELGLKKKALDFLYVWTQATSLALERETKGK